MSLSARTHFRPNSFQVFGEVATVNPTNAKPARAGARPPRAKLRGTILALVLLPNRRQHRGALHQLSMSGGLLHVDNPLDESVPVELVFHLKDNTIREIVVPLLPMWATRGWLQPFRFPGLSREGKKALRESLRPFLSTQDGR
jgi:hypothetical protein